MFGYLVRAAAIGAAGALAGTVLHEVLDPILDVIKNAVGTNHDLYVWLQLADSWFVFVVFASLLMGMLARAIAENRVGGGI